jgi:hypothetical protein
MISYDVLTDMLEVTLRALLPAVRQEIVGWLDHKSEGALNDFYRDLMSKSLLTDWLTKQGMHVSGTQTPYEMMQFYRTYATKDIAPLVKQDVLVMIGNEDHYVPLHQFSDQIATLTNVRSLAARLFTRAEQGQNHCQMGNLGLAIRVMLDWISGLTELR